MNTLGTQLNKLQRNPSRTVLDDQSRQYSTNPQALSPSSTNNTQATFQHFVQDQWNQPVQSANRFIVPTVEITSPINNKTSEQPEDRIKQSNSFGFDSFIDTNLTKQNSSPAQPNYKLEAEFDTFTRVEPKFLASPVPNPVKRQSSGILTFPDQSPPAPTLQPSKSARVYQLTEPMYQQHHIIQSPLFPNPGNPYEFSQKPNLLQPTAIQLKPTSPQIHESLQDSMAPMFNQ